MGERRGALRLHPLRAFPGDLCSCCCERRNMASMNRRLVQFLPVAFSLLLLAADQPKIPAMPGAVTSNAVASLKGGIEVYSMMGMGTKKTWDDVSNKMYLLRFRSGKWIEGRPVPGVAGR